ncbi:hypothetical protein [Bacilli bacterium]|jgi:hypothetical protein
MYEISLAIAIITLICYFILTNGKEGARTIVRNAYADYPYPTMPYMQEYLEANAGIYVSKFVFGGFAKLAFKILVIGGMLCLPIAAISIYANGIFSPLSGIAGCTFLLKICTDTESFYSHNISTELFTQNIIRRLEKKFPHGVPSRILYNLSTYEYIACDIMAHTFHK